MHAVHGINAKPVIDLLCGRKGGRARDTVYDRWKMIWGSCETGYVNLCCEVNFHPIGSVSCTVSTRTVLCTYGNDWIAHSISDFPDVSLHLGLETFENVSRKLMVGIWKRQDHLFFGKSTPFWLSTLGVVVILISNKAPAYHLQGTDQHAIDAILFFQMVVGYSIPPSPIFF